MRSIAYGSHTNMYVSKIVTAIFPGLCRAIYPAEFSHRQRDRNQRAIAPSPTGTERITGYTVSRKARSAPPSSFSTVDCSPSGASAEASRRKTKDKPKTARTSSMHTSQSKTPAPVRPSAPDAAAAGSPSTSSSTPPPQARAFPRCHSDVSRAPCRLWL